MSVPPILAIFMLLSTPVLSLEAIFPLTKPNCEKNCGNVSIPYPFGTTKDCYLNRNFMITCNDSYNPPQTFLGNSTINVTRISLEGQLHILSLIGFRCHFREDYNETSRPRLWLNQQFTINSTINKFVAVGCDTSAFLQGYAGNRRLTTGCISFCDYASDVTNGTCAGGGGCCQTSIPPNLSKFNLTANSFYNHTYVRDFSPCSYAFVVEEGQFIFSLDNLKKLESLQKLPTVLDWIVGEKNETCESAKRNMSSYACQKNTICRDNTTSNYSGGYRCFCQEGYQGNPYLVDGCQDIDECYLDTNNCTHKKLCVNREGSYSCNCPKGYYGDGMGSEGCSPKNKRSLVTWILATGIPVGTIVSVAGCCWGYFWMRRRQLLLMKKRNLERNGGKILEEKQKGSSVTVRTFTAEELKKATNNYHDSTIIGQGGNGVVYKGYLKEKKEIAIKKSKTVDHDKIEQFINEVIVLLRIHHRNVVELLGCCLEDEVPLLVYEFISNSTLYEHLHKKIDASVPRWNVRLRIAAETANALSYLHSAASPPIIHRDVKTMNILLDENWTAKVADFGASRLVPLNGSQISTMVQGTLGYLDPEYFQTGLLTEKSDVYSFGVVLLELLTGKVPVSYDRPEDTRNLSNLFLSSVRQNRLVEILDPNISSEVRIEEVNEVAMLAKRCLNVKGDDRPTMEEVSTELKGLLKANHGPLPDANVHSEEIQPLAGEESVDALINLDSPMTTTTFSVEKHMMLPPGDGR